MENKTNISLGETTILLTLFSSLRKNNIFGGKYLSPVKKV